MDLLVGLDVGTSGLKAIAVDRDSGSVVAQATHAYPLSTPRPGWAEQEAADFEGAAVLALRALVEALGPRKAQVRSIGVTGQMHSAVLLDEANRAGAAGHPLVRHPHHRRVRGDPRHDRRGGVAARRGQPRDAARCRAARRSARSR